MVQRQAVNNNCQQIETTVTTLDAYVVSSRDSNSMELNQECVSLGRVRGVASHTSGFFRSSSTYVSDYCFNRLRVLIAILQITTSQAKSSIIMMLYFPTGNLLVPVRRETSERSWNAKCQGLIKIPLFGVCCIGLRLIYYSDDESHISLLFVSSPLACYLLHWLLRSTSLRAHTTVTTVTTITT
jgi:hypothetical protein